MAGFMIPERSRGIISTLTCHNVTLACIRGLI